MPPPRPIAATAVVCPSYNNQVCGGHGTCALMSNVGLSTNDVLYTDWDSNQILGCVCDEGYTGYNCGQRECVLGNDPYNFGQQEIQSIITSLDHQFDTQVITLTGTDIDQVHSSPAPLPSATDSPRALDRCNAWK